MPQSKKQPVITTTSHIELNERQWKNFQKSLNNPPKANSELKKLLKGLKATVTLWGTTLTFLSKYQLHIEWKRIV